ncbi:NYN domain-containing protein [Ornithinicoccus halotolerans]|uniref:NYN domain-containing protein n=1 Tax=Ornithinicoccus halotolerans TaxID=1748220 RepID=UPI001295ABB8|nr:NYN domain-containing protein [Ornithinicoccus halotolerans]
MDEEERIALFLDYENLALGTRDHLGGISFQLRPVSDALAERGRVVVRRAYADWSYFDEDRRMLTRSHVELIEMPQRMGYARKNAADIKMAVDALELAFVRDYISTFVVATGDSDFTPLVHKLRELNKRVIGVGVRHSTSKLLPPACDEFLYYDDLEGVEPAGESGEGHREPKTAPRSRGQGSRVAPPSEPAAETVAEEERPAVSDVDDVAVLVAQTVSGLQRTGGGQVSASELKRTLLRKDPTFSEAAHGFRAFGELLSHLEQRGVVELSEGPAKGDPVVTLAELGDREDAFALLRQVVAAESDGKGTGLSGLKDRLRRERPQFSEKALGYRSFLQFCKGAAAAGVVGLAWDDDAGDYLLTVPD